jgi:hypothetical protein
LGESEGAAKARLTSSVVSAEIARIDLPLFDRSWQSPGEFEAKLERHHGAVGGDRGLLGSPIRLRLVVGQAGPGQRIARES